MNKENFGNYSIELPEDVSVTMGLKKKLLGDLFLDEYIPYIEVEYNV